MASVRRALVVDDDAAIRILVCRILGRHGYAVDAVKDGAEAIEQLLQHDYAVIVLDLMMPRIDGAGVVRYLAQHQPATLQKVIVMTAFGDKAIRTVCPPVVRFIEKPFDINRLLDEATGCSAADDEAPNAAAPSEPQTAPADATLSDQPHPVTPR